MSVIHQMLRDLEAGRENGRVPGAPTGLAAAGATGGGLSQRLPRVVIATSLLVLVAAGLLRGPAPVGPGTAPGATMSVAASVPPAAAAYAPPAVSPNVPPAVPANVPANVPAKAPAAVPATAPAPVTLATASTRASDLPAEPAPGATPARTTSAAAVPMPGPAHPPAAPEKAEPAVAAAAEPPRIERRAGVSPGVEGAEAHYRKGLAAYNAGRLEEALRALRATLAEQPGHVPARQALVAILVDRAEWASAQAALAETLSADPRQAQFALLSSQIQARLGDPAGAIRTLTAAAHDKAPAELHAALAGLLSQARRDREALAHWIAALGRAPDRGAWWLGFGVSLEADGRAGDAAHAYQRALAAGGLNAEVADFARTRVASLR